MAASRVDAERPRRCPVRPGGRDPLREAPGAWQGPTCAWRPPGSDHQLNFYFLFPWGRKCLICMQINDPSSGKHFSLAFLPATPSSLSWTLEGLFELSWRLSRALKLPRALLPELRRIKDTVTFGTRGGLSLDTVKNGSQKPCECVCKNTLFLQRSMIVNVNKGALSL